MSRIEIPMETYLALNAKVTKLESALDSISKESSINKEKIENIKTIVLDLEGESVWSRLFKWKSIIKKISDVVNPKITLQT